MHQVPHYDERRCEVLHALIEAHPFATLIVGAGTDVVANHVPVLLRPGATPSGLLVGHIARANPVWSSTKAGSASLLIFQGVDHYISPRWYRSGEADGKAVPTWDYSVVHARGPIEWIEDKSWLQALLEDMAGAFERGSKNPWQPEEMPADYREAMLRRIVGFQVPVNTMQGKFKLNQGSTAEDRAGVIAELKRIGTDSAVAMAEAIDRAKSK